MWPFRRSKTAAVEPERYAKRLAELHPNSAMLPQMGGEVLLHTSADFAEIVLLYALARGLSLSGPDDVRIAAQKAALWYYGLESQ